ncbi:MAG: hypothetical protein LAO21_15435 [Acidobacteriia bacterium]|nr:hypothetical protein [Terriglobia bacterium]
MKRHLWIGICTTLLVILLGTSALVSKPGQDLTAIKQNIEVFEGILSTVLQQGFPDPFAVLEKPKGAYLDGFGTVFSFEIDIATVKRPNLFSQARSTPEEEKKAFNERLPKLKELMEKTLAEHGDSMTSIGPEEQIAVVAQLFNSGFLSRPLELKTVTVRTAKKNLLEYKAGRLNYEDLKKKMEVSQY